MAAQRRGQRNGRPGRSRAAIAALLVCGSVAAIGSGAGYAAWSKARNDASAIQDALTATTAPSSGGPRSATTRPTPAPAPTTARPTPTVSHPPKPPTVPSSGTGAFRTARATGAAYGHGTIRRYKVQVEGGIALSPSAAAHEIAAILGDRRGWTANGHDGFQLVSSGSYDFVIKIATPDTVDTICGAAGLRTRGEVNCDVGATVVVNLKRWMLGSPEFDGPIEEYRALIINHEVGHRIGHGHEGCSGTGRLAPVMMQQIKGLHGCIANAWPYDRQGRYIQGPPVA